MTEYVNMAGAKPITAAEPKDAQANETQVNETQANETLPLPGSLVTAGQLSNAGATIL